MSETVWCLKFAATYQLFEAESSKSLLHGIWCNQIPWNFCCKESHLIKWLEIATARRWIQSKRLKFWRRGMGFNWRGGGGILGCRRRLGGLNLRLRVNCLSLMMGKWFGGGVDWIKWGGGGLFGCYCWSDGDFLLMRVNLLGFMWCGALGGDLRRFDVVAEGFLWGWSGSYIYNV